MHKTSPERAGNNEGRLELRDFGLMLFVIGTVLILTGLSVRVYGENASDHETTDIGALDAAKLARTGTDVFLSGTALVLICLALLTLFMSSPRTLDRERKPPLFRR